ncbi:hypothetical protein EDS67_22935 [candidate division KSB1 bacterium]|nr:MAG: hypothetical protein EDS67_22935 [candidate division KSB1 bacterium]MBC6948666.1 hypothetical protein [candidate division KSB1 bacterium]MCE7944107.1 hypothetical protein [Chlorobi bacterium CHB1]
MLKFCSPSRIHAFCACCALLLVGLATTTLLAQTRTHNLGDFKLRIEAGEIVNTNDVQPTGEWPQDHFRYAHIVFHNTGHVVGSWVDAEGAVHAKEQFIGGPVSFNAEAPYGLREVRRYEPPEVWVYANGELQLSSRRFNGEVDPALPADMMIENRYKSAPGFDVLKRSYSFSNPDHDDYVIFYNRYLVTFDWDEDPDPETSTTQTLEDVYFVVGYSFQTAEGTYITYSRWYEEGKDDWASFENFSSQLVPGGRQLAISYSWDGDHPDLTEFESGGPDFDDTGDPRFAIGEEGSTAMPSGEFISSAYSGFAALHVDRSPQDRTDDPTQPISIIANMSIYNVWDSDFPGFATEWDWAASGTKQTVEDQAGWPGDASAQEDEYPFQAFGPYDMALGDSVVIVYAVGVNGISRQLAIEKGLEWRDWYRGVAGVTFDDAAKNELLATGKDSLFQTLDRALWAWNQNLNIPSPLPAPDLTVTSGPNRIDLSWEDLSAVNDFQSGVPDLQSYRIYRKRGNFLVDEDTELNSDGTHLLWERIADVPATETSYSDLNVVRGEAYHYAVTAIDNSGLESSKYANRSELPAIAFQPGLSSADAVRVVPNPFISGAGDFNFSGTRANTILFVNLPAYCTLRIYTASGDLIKVIKHESGSADNQWDLITESNQYVASGVYLLQVANARDVNQQPVSGSIHKFVVVR